MPGFLPRRRSRPALGITSPAAVAGPAQDDKNRQSSSIINRVSRLLSVRTRIRTLSTSGAGAVTNIRRSSFTFSNCSPDPSPLSTEFDEDIRPPSGLGRRDSSISPSPDASTSDISLPSIHAGWEASVKARKRRSLLIKACTRRVSLSSPNLAYPAVRPTLPPRTSSERSQSLDRLPEPVLDAIATACARISRSDVARLALVSRTWLAPARRALYNTIDLATLSSERVTETLLCILCKHAHLAAFVHTFSCTTPLLSVVPDGVVLARCLSNMPSLEVLTVPTFNVHAFYPRAAAGILPFRLRRLVILCETLSASDRLALVTWIRAHPSVEELALPSIQDEESGEETEVLQMAMSTPSIGSTSAIVPFPQTRSGSDSSTSRLSMLHAPPLLTMDLLGSSSSYSPSSSSPSPPPSPSPSSSASMPLFAPSHLSLRSVTVRINTTLYSGLRPTTLMRALARQDLRALRIHFGRRVDPRSIERIVRAIGSVFGRTKDENEDGHDGNLPYEQPGLEVLELQLTGRADGNANEAFYSLLTSILSGLPSLRVIRLRCAHTTGSGIRSGAFDATLRRMASHTSMRFDGDGAGASADIDTNSVIISEKELDCVAVWRGLLPRLNDVEFFTTARWTGVTV